MRWGDFTGFVVQAFENEPLIHEVSWQEVELGMINWPLDGLLFQLFSETLKQQIFFKCHLVAVLCLIAFILWNQQKSSCCTCPSSSGTIWCGRNFMWFRSTPLPRLSWNTSRGGVSFTINKILKIFRFMIQNSCLYISLNHILPHQKQLLFIHWSPYFWMNLKLVRKKQSNPPWFMKKWIYGLLVA